MISFSETTCNKDFERPISLEMEYEYSNDPHFGIFLYDYFNFNLTYPYELILVIADN